MAAELITIFGGSGFIGRHLVRLLARQGYRLRVAVRNPNTAHFLRPMGDVGQIQIVQTNIRDENSVSAALEGADAVINLVGILSETGKQKFDAVHAVAPANLARLVAARGIDRFVHLSSLGADPKATSKYAASKGRGDQAVQEACPKAVILRPSIIFGPEDGFFNRFAALARYSFILPLFGGGDTKYQPIFVGDVAKAVMAALTDPSARGNIYELGGPHIYTFQELMGFILDVTERKRFLLPLPVGLAKFISVFTGMLPKPLLTWDQVKLLQADNIVGAEDAHTISDLGLEDLTSIEINVPTYLYRFRRYGQYEVSDIG